MRVTLDVDALLGAGSALVVILGGFAAGYVSLRRWIVRTAHPAQQAADQLRTSNGKTVAEHVESAVTQIAAVRSDLSALQQMAVTNRDIATAAQALAKSTSERLDRHLAGHA